MASKRSAKQLENETPSKKAFDFSEGIDSELYDGVLQVEGRLFYVMKGHLARHSDYFKNLFFKNYADSKKNIIPLEDVVPADAFQHFLELISGGSRLNDDVIEEVLKISQMWFAEVPLEKAKEYLLKRSNLVPMEKFIIAEKYNFSDLKNALFSNVLTVVDMNALLPNQDVSDFEPDTTTLIAKRLLEISGIPRPIPAAPVAPEPQAEIPIAPEQNRQEGIIAFLQQELYRTREEAERERMRSDRVRQGLEHRLDEARAEVIDLRQQLNRN